MGPPGPARRRLALAYCELLQREVEYLCVSPDVTESDIKQRREIKHKTAVYENAAAVRACLLGRVLVIDGIEKAVRRSKQRCAAATARGCHCPWLPPCCSATLAHFPPTLLVVVSLPVLSTPTHTQERNVLPVINNLLENREMALEDGRFIVSASRYNELKARHGEDVVQSWHLIPAHPDFFVIAIGLPVPPYFGNPLDPPLRSRFQARTEGMPRVGSQLLRVRRVAPGVNSAVLGRVVVRTKLWWFGVGRDRCVLQSGVTF